MNKEKILYILQKYKNIDKELELQNRFIKEIEDNFRCPLKPINGKTDFYTLQEMSKELKDLQRQRKETLLFKDEVRKEIDSLDTLYKLIIYSFYVEGKRWEQISRHLSYSVRQCKNLRTQALKQLEKQLEENKSITKLYTNY